MNFTVFAVLMKTVIAILFAAILITAVLMNYFSYRTSDTVELRGRRYTHGKKILIRLVVAATVAGFLLFFISVGMDCFSTTTEKVLNWKTYPNNIEVSNSSDEKLLQSLLDTENSPGEKASSWGIDSDGNIFAHSYNDYTTFKFGDFGDEYLDRGDVIISRTDFLFFYTETMEEIIYINTNRP